MNAGATNKIVVGVDGSEPSEHALAWAIDEARLRNGRIEAVTAWFLAPMIYGATNLLPPTVSDRAVEADAEEIGNAAANRVRDAGVPVESIVRAGHAAEVLVEQSAGADLLVVGSRGHGGFAGLLLGSVSAQCAHHADCPVVVVR
jgi:nucleotide-binding universal stress UspA family protein